MLLRSTAASMTSPSLQTVQQLVALAEELATPGCKRRLQRQLEQLASSEGRQEPLLTVEQLQYRCYYSAAVSAKLAEQPSGVQRAELAAAAASSARAMRQLEPGNPKTHVVAASALRFDTAMCNHKQTVQLYLRAFELAQQQRSDIWSANSAVNALCLATQHPSEVGHSALARAVAAFEQMDEAALRRCKRLLPELWVQPLAELGRQMLPGAHEQLCSSGSSRHAGGAQRPLAERHCWPALQHRWQLSRST